MNQTPRELPTRISRTAHDSIDWMRRISVALARPLVSILYLANSSLGAQPAAFEKPVVVISTCWSETGVKAGGHTTLAIVLDIQTPYHINAHTAKAPFIPTSIELVGGPDFLLSSTAIFPNPHEIDFGVEGTKERLRVFSGRTVAYFPIAVEGTAPPGKHEIKIRIAYQAYNDKTCLLPAAVIQSVVMLWSRRSCTTPEW